MNRFILSLSIVIISSAAFSQRQYFIYVQSEPEEAFFLRMNEKVHNSTASGYFILSRLKDSLYQISIGSPQNKWPEQKFTIDIKGKDHGYLLKNFGEKGRGLFDLQTSSVQMGSATSNNALQKTEQREVSIFTDILSRAANDPSLKEKPVSQPVVVKDSKETGKEDVVVKKEEVLIDKKEESPAVKKEEPQVVITEEMTAKTEELKTNPLEEYKRSVVTKKSESSTSEGLGLTFIDDYGNGKKDTVSIFIFNPKANFAEIKEPVREEKQFLDINNEDTVKKNEPVRKKVEKEVLPVSSKSNCASVAVESDFLKLRKKMAAETTDEGMVVAAKKYFKTKCFTVSQVKNLSTLFLNDNGKYKFFDAAYTHVSDPDSFPSLQAELKDEYYLNRFKAMLH